MPSCISRARRSRSSNPARSRRAAKISETSRLGLCRSTTSDTAARSASSKPAPGARSRTTTPIRSPIGSRRAAASSGRLSPSTCGAPYSARPVRQTRPSTESSSAGSCHGTRSVPRRASGTAGSLPKPTSTARRRAGTAASTALSSSSALAGASKPPSIAPASVSSRRSSSAASRAAGGSGGSCRGGAEAVRVEADRAPARPASRASPPHCNQPAASGMAGPRPVIAAPVPRPIAAAVPRPTAAEVSTQRAATRRPQISPARKAGMSSNSGAPLGIPACTAVAAPATAAAVKISTTANRCRGTEWVDRFTARAVRRSRARTVSPQARTTGAKPCTKAAATATATRARRSQVAGEPGLKVRTSCTSSVSAVQQGSTSIVPPHGALCPANGVYRREARRPHPARAAAAVHSPAPGARRGRRRPCRIRE